MVDLTRIVKDYRDSGAVHSFVNLYGFISDSLLLTKSGDVGVVLKVEPHDYESLDRDELAEVTDRFEASLRSFDHRFRIYQYAFKRNGAHIPPQTHSADAIVTQALRDRARYLEAKGGVAMELRFAEHARATKDLDLGMEGTRADRLRSLRNALGAGFDEFSFRIKAQTRDMEQADTIRVQVAIQHRTRSWQTIEVDLGPSKADQIDLIEPQVRGLVELGLPVVSPIRCLGLAEQVAQKLHACTGPGAAGRARDVLDILLIDSLGQLDYAAAADAARHVFSERATHPFPPLFAMPPEWRPELEAMAHELGFALTASAEIERRFLDVIRNVSGH